MKRNDGIIKFLLVLLFEPDYLEVRLLRHVGLLNMFTVRAFFLHYIISQLFSSNKVSYGCPKVQILL